ncbi:MAG TPA: CBS domain-containing protein [Polyangia bacterium]
MSLERFTRRELVTIGPDRPAEEAARLMRAKHVGAVIVVEDGQPVGIVTDRDLVVRLLADWSPGTPVRAVMTRDIVVARIDDAIDFAFYTMRQHGIRRLPIVNGEGALIGLVSVDDLLVLLGGEVSSIVEAVVDNRGP